MRKLYDYRVKDIFERKTFKPLSVDIFFHFAGKKKTLARLTECLLWYHCVSGKRHQQKNFYFEKSNCKIYYLYRTHFNKVETIKRKCPYILAIRRGAKAVKKPCVQVQSRTSMRQLQTCYELYKKGTKNNKNRK